MINATKSLTRRSDRGFTLIELLVVIAIIAILAALILAALTSAQRGARDSERRSDLNQYKVALSSFAADNNNLYPVTGATANAAITSSSAMYTALNGGGYLTTFLDDESASAYYYVDNDTDFGICANLENGSTDYAVGPTYAGAPRNGATATVCTVQS